MFTSEGRAITYQFGGIIGKMVCVFTKYFSGIS